MDRRRDPALSADKCAAVIFIDRDDRRIAEKAAKLCRLSHILADHRDQADCCGFLIHHADRHLIGNNA